MFAIRDDRSVSQLLNLHYMLLNFVCREYVNQEGLTKAARKVGEAKKHESKLNGTSTLEWPLTFYSHSQDGVFHIDTISLSPIVIYHVVHSRGIKE